MTKKSMGYLLLASLIFLNASTFTNLMAKDLESATAMDSTQDEIRDAIVDSLIDHDLDCLESRNNDKFKASELKIKDVFNGNFTLEVSLEHPLPVINLQNARIVDQQTHKYLMTVTLDANMRTVKTLHFVSFHNVKKVRVNRGTIVVPSYVEYMVDGAPFQKVVCN